jgi:hypothetical protein
MPHQSSHPPPTFKESQNFDRPTPQKRKNSRQTTRHMSSPLFVFIPTTLPSIIYNFEACNQNFKETKPRNKDEEENTST